MTTKEKKPEEEVVATFGKSASKLVLYSYLTSADEGDYR